MIAFLILALLGSYVTAKLWSFSEQLRRRRSFCARSSAADRFGLEIPVTKEDMEAEKKMISKFLTEPSSYFFPLSKVEVDEINGGMLNFCFRCSEADNSGNIVFIKHAKDELKALKDVPLSAERLRYEFDGMRAFSKYNPQWIPQPYFYDDERKILVQEWLHHYVPLREFFVNKEINIDSCRAMGTLMGRSHARSHERVLLPAFYEAYKRRFENKEVFDFWKDRLFAPAFEKLKSGSSRSIGPTDQDLLSIISALSSNSNKNNIDGASASLDIGISKIEHALEELQTIYLTKKEALVHADLHCNNVMVYVAPPGEEDEDKDSSNFKVIDFEKCAFGPAGLDLGMFLSNFLWYYAAQSHPAKRRALMNGALAVIDSYRSAFRVQLVGAGGVVSELRKAQPDKEISIDVEGMLNEILRDSLGFMGLYAFFLLVSMPEVDILPVHEIPELNWGDSEGRLVTVRKRQLTMAVDALIKFNEAITSSSSSSSSDAPIQVNAQLFSSIFQADEKLLVVDHMTEFWY